MPSRSAHMRFTVRKAAIPPIMEPTVGMQYSGFTSRFMNSLAKRATSRFSSGMPWMSGYTAATPSRRAWTWASTPTCSAGRPGMPISMRTNFSPESASMRSTSFLISRMEALARPFKPLASSLRRTTSGLMGVCRLSMEILRGSAGQGPGRLWVNGE